MLDGYIYGDGRHASGPLGSAAIDDTVGGKVWRWLHPGQEAAEYEMTGKAPPPPTTAGDVLDTAVERTLDAASAAGEHLAEGWKLAKIALVGGAILYGLHLWNEAQKNRRAKDGGE